MATDGSKSIRKDFKFESYLRRVFDPETFSKVRYYDMCVIKFVNGSRGLKHIIVGEQWVHVTDDPPKNLTKLFHFKNMASIEIIRDFPDFMEGEARKTVQHLLLKLYEEEVPGKLIKDKANGTNGNNKSIRPTNEEGNSTLNVNSQGPDAQRIPVQTTDSKGGCCAGRSRKRQNPAPEVMPTDPDTTHLITDTSLNSEFQAENNPQTLLLDTSSLYINPTLQVKETQQQRKLVELHIYILNQDTPALMLIKSAWNNYRLQGTLQMDPVFLENTLSTVKYFPDDERLKVSFRQLKNDLQSSKDNMEAVFEYTNELYNASRRYFSIKKLFWSNPDLYTFLVDQLGLVLPKPKHSLVQENRQDRVDELEFSVMILDTLSSMFDETESLTERINTIGMHQSKDSFALINAIVTDISLPRRAQKDDPPGIRYSQQEEDSMLQKLANTGAAILAALLQHVREVPMHNRDDLTEAEIIEYIVSHLEANQDFFNRALAEVFKLISPTGMHKSHHITPQQSVLLYRHFSLLESLTRYSAVFRKFLAYNYQEEFKYFVQPQVIKHRMSSDYPITVPTLRLIWKITDSVMSHSDD